jgi:hypothetical protein
VDRNHQEGPGPGDVIGIHVSLRNWILRVRISPGAPFSGSDGIGIRAGFKILILWVRVPPAAPDPCGQIGKAISLKRRSIVSSNLTRGTRRHSVTRLALCFGMASGVGELRSRRYQKPAPDSVTGMITEELAESA